MHTKGNIEKSDRWEHEAYIDYHRRQTSESPESKTYIKNYKSKTSESERKHNSTIYGVQSELNSLGAKGGVPGWYTANTLQGHGRSNHYIPAWELGIHS